MPFPRDLARDWTPPALLRAAKRSRSGARRGSRDLTYRVGSTDIVLPAGHALPKYRARWHLYDEPLRYVAEALRALDPNFRAIDIGANVGDSAAAIGVQGSRSVPTPVLCIEGDPAYLGYLRRNARALGPQVEVEASFVGTDSGSLALDQLRRHDGTTSAAEALSTPSHLSDHAASDPGTAIPVRRLDAIVELHPSFRGAELMKLDTDGFDFSILLANEDLLALTGPVLFFEYLLESPEDAERAQTCMDMLASIGYADFLVFDNFGNPLLRTDQATQLRDLDRYLLSNLAFGQAVYYLDICAVTPGQREVLDRVTSKMAALAAPTTEAPGTSSPR